MAFSRRALSLSGVGVVLVGAILVACSDGGDLLGPKPPAQPKPASPTMAMECLLDTRAETLSCAPAAASVQQGGASMTKLYGREDVYATLIGSNIVNNSADSTISVDVAVKNLLRQPIGTVDGTTAHPDGVYTFFEFVSVPGTAGYAEVLAPDTMDLVGAGQPAFKYNGMLAPDSTSAPRKWTFRYTIPGATITFGLRIRTEVQYPDGWVDITPKSVLLEADSQVTLTHVLRTDFSGLVTSAAPVTWASSDTAIAKVDTTGGQVRVIGTGLGVTTIIGTHFVRPDSTLTGVIPVRVNNRPMAMDDTLDVIGNVQLKVPTSGLRANDNDADPLTVTARSENSANGSATFTVDSLTYQSKPGFVGTDEIKYVVTDGRLVDTAKIVLRVRSRFWFVDSTSVVGARDGRDRSPFATVAEAASAASPGDTILVSHGTSESGPIALRARQVVIGAGSSAAPLNRILNGTSITLLKPGASPTIAGTLELADSVVVRGIRVRPSLAGAAISGSNFGTATLREMSVRSANGPALSLATGKLDAVLDSVSVTKSASTGVFLSGVKGTITVGGGSVDSVAGTAFHVNGDSSVITWNGSIHQRNPAELVRVEGGHQGSITFQGGTLSATAGTGLQFNNADGAYNFRGTTTLSGGDAGIDVLGNSGGTINVATASGSSASITNPSGPAVEVANSASTLAFTYGGTIEKTNGGSGVLIHDNNVAGPTISFTGSSKTLSTGAADAISVLDDLASVTFAGGNLVITTTTGRGLSVVQGGTIQVTGANNTITTTQAAAVQVINASSGAAGINFRRIDAANAANAIVLNNVPGAGFQVSGTGALGTGGTLQANTKAIVISGVDSTRFVGVQVNAPVAVEASNFGGLLFQTSSVAASNGVALGLTTGRLHVSDVAVSASNGAALSANGVGLDGTFSSLVSTTTAGNGISLTNSTGSFTATGGNINVSGAGGGAAVLVNGNTGVGFTYGGTVTQSASAALLDVSNGHTGTLGFSGALSASGGSRGLRFDNANGSYSFAGTTTLAGDSTGVDILNGSGGSFTFGASTSVTPTNGTAFNVNGSTPAVAYNGNLTKAAGSTGLLVDITGQASGTGREIVFQNGTLSAVAGTGIQLSGAKGTVNFNGTTTLNGTATGIDVVNASDGSFVFGTNSSLVVTGAGETALDVNGGTPALVFRGTITHNTGRAVSVQNVSADSVVLTDTIISGTSALQTGRGILAQNNTGGIIAFDGPAKSFFTGANPAVSLANNTGATLRFGGGGLAITTTTGNGFSATGGGTLIVRGANNTIASSGGVALNVQSTTIGTDGLLFRRIDANGGTSGIILSSTGNLNGLEVTGDGSTAGSGGTIQNMTSHGVSLDQVLNPRFTRMSIQNTAGSGVNGTRVTHFTLTNSTINNSGTSPVAGRDESNIDFFSGTAPGTETNLTGVVTITGNTLSNAYYHGIDIVNYNGTISELTLSGNVITTPTTAAASLGSGIKISALGSTGNVSQITRATISNNQVYNVPTGLGLTIVCGNASSSGPAGRCGTEGSGTDVVNITNNTIRGQNASTRIGSEGMSVNVNGRGQGNFNITGNDIRHVTGTALGHSAFGQARMTSTVANNTIVANNSFAAQGMSIGADSTANMPSHASFRVTVSGNNVSQTDGVGIYAIVRASSDSLRVKLLNNTVAAPTAASARPGIRIDSGSAAGNTWLCMRAEGNTTAGGASATSTAPGIGIRKEGSSASVNVFGIHNLASSGANTPVMENHINSLNPGSASGTFGVGGTTKLSSTSSNYASCSLP